jgi:hypothetical protein
MVSAAGKVKTSKFEQYGSLEFSVEELEATTLLMVRQALRLCR